MTVREVVLSASGKYKCPFCKFHIKDKPVESERIDDAFFLKYSYSPLWYEHVACWAVSPGRSTLEIWI